MLTERAEEADERVGGLPEMFHGASLAAQIITMMDLESARKAKVEEVMEFRCWLNTLEFNYFSC